MQKLCQYRGGEGLSCYLLGSKTSPRNSVKAKKLGGVGLPVKVRLVRADNQVGMNKTPLIKVSLYCNPSLFKRLYKVALVTPSCFAHSNLLPSKMRKALSITFFSCSSISSCKERIVLLLLSNRD